MAHAHLLEQEGWIHFQGYVLPKKCGMGMGMGTEYIKLSPSSPEVTTRSTSNLGVWARRDAKPYRRHAVLYRARFGRVGWVPAIYLPSSYIPKLSNM